jgi:hypothetical protein
LEDALEIVLLCAIRDGDTELACDPSALVAEAQCLLHCIPQGASGAVKLGVLCQIAQNGGGGGGTSQVFSGNYADAAPPFVPTTTTAIAFDTSTDGEWHWYNGAWH